MLAHQLSIRYYAPLAQVAHQLSKGTHKLAPLAQAVHQLSKRYYAPLAQLVEQLTLNQWVPGSSP